MSKDKPDAWMPFYIGDYKADTGRLRCEHHGAYMLLIMDYWRNGPPPDDDAQLASITCNDPKSWRRIRPMVAPFFQIRDGRWFQKRIEAELERWAGKREKAIEKARIAAEKRWKKDAPSIPQALLEECPSASSSTTVARASDKALAHSRARAPASEPEGSPALRLVESMEETPEQACRAWREALGRAEAGKIVNAKNPDMLSELAEFVAFGEAFLAEHEAKAA